MPRIKPKALLLNGDRLNFDGKLSFAPIRSAGVTIDEQGSSVPDARWKGWSDHAILISKEVPLGRAVIARLPESIRLICEAGTGVDNIDVNAANARGIQVFNVPGYSTAHVAELTIGFLLMMSSGLFRSGQGSVTRNHGTVGGRSAPRISEVAGKTLGVIGAGAIGRQVITLARALDMRVLVHHRKKSSWGDPHIQEASLDTVLRKSDFLSLHCPLTPRTSKLLNKASLARMKKGAFVINTARGGLVDHHALAAALRSGHLGGAALDVQDPEPLPMQHSLRKLPNVILTGHIGWRAIEARRRLMEGVAENISTFISTGRPDNLVPP